MKQLLFAIFIPFLFLAACSDGDHPAINGMWQLKTIDDGNNRVQQVDTVFYAFQRQAVFSYTILPQEENKSPIYGYIDFPDRNRLHIQLDKNHYYQAKLTLWNDTSVVYDIHRLDAKQLVLSHNGSVYRFSKY
ncbi:MAG: lipocalin-like domain-containing protein [Dysgonamonadaceae bacterium]|jgi:hypothetical protein|nr:lipocalin-like domain-containing protein [Dysgonamonadaceae bacterium]